MSLLYLFDNKQNKINLFDTLACVLPKQQKSGKVLIERVYVCGLTFWTFRDGETSYNHDNCVHGEIQTEGA